MSLPSGYTRVEYIESSGTQWIDTDLYTGAKTKIEAELAYTSISGAHYSGVYIPGSNFLFGINGNHEVYLGGSVKIGNAADTSSFRIILDSPGKSASINGTKYTFSSGTSTASVTYPIFAYRDVGSIVGYANYKLYSFKIHESGTLVRNFIPCINSSGTVGLYDDVNSRFYTNAGSGSFTAGNVILTAPVVSAAVSETTVTLSWTQIGGASGYLVKRDGIQIADVSGTTFTENLPNEDKTYLYTVTPYNDRGTGESRSASVHIVPTIPDDFADFTQLEYIETTGTQYIDTGFRPNQNTRVVADFRASAANRHVFGARTSFPNNAFVLFWVSNASYCIQVNNSTFNGGSFDTSARCTADMTASAFKINGVTKATYSVSAFQTEYNLYIASCPNSSESENMPGRYYSCQVYDNGRLIRDYVPCVDASGEAGMFDLVNSRFYRNAGTGSFIAGPVLIVIPESPRNLTAQGHSGGVFLSWSASDGAAGYRIYRDGVQIGETADIYFSDAYGEAYTAVVYGVSAYNDAGESAVSEISGTIPGSDDVLLDLITDRTEADVREHTKKGVYNANDLNRVSTAAAYVRKLLVKYGYLCGSDVRADWETNEIPRRSEMDQHLASVTDLDVIRYAAERIILPASMDALTWEDANAIEAFLLSCGRAAERIPLSWMYCGEIGCGEM